ncbi:nuclear protein DGCR14 [Crepidotus variabilis]|uniref:Nuclear protein DGCR14 n=1 Tax=Crepidotus variabilis TaxID=179855 RepID=A0A9P6EMY2_9AGAR|nr:nuclear protein DGCR14 [Crepidotus variabilis]
MSEKPNSVPSEAERSLNKQVVLEEDEYTDALSHIIARDFFPSLVRLDATNEYLDALSTRDPHLINASVRRLEEVTSTPLVSTSRRKMGPVAETPGRTPFGYTAETPVPYASSELGEPQRKRARYDVDMNLDDFQARYTSEDNSSFTQILDEENQERKERYGWAWEAQRRVEAQRDRMIEQRERMLIEPAPEGVTGVRGRFAIELPTPAGLITNGNENEGKHLEGEETNNDGNEVKDESNALVVVTNDEPTEDVMAPTKDKRKAGVDGWNFKARNAFMFPPDADVSPYHLPLTAGEEKVNLKKVAYGNTRLQEQDVTSVDKPVSAPPSPTRSRINAAITGTPYHPTSGREEGFGLVPDLPSPTPAELGPSAMKQLMTWGTLNATPRIINQTGGDIIEPTTPFRISEVSSREAIGLKLSNKASKSLRLKAEMYTPRSSRPSHSGGKKGSMAPPSMTPRRSETAGSLTPAAQRLLARTTFGTAGARRAEAMERDAKWSSDKGKGEMDLDRVRWTPTPSPVTRR